MLNFLYFMFTENCYVNMKYRNFNMKNQLLIIIE